MIQQSLDVLANYQQDATPHDQVEAWITSSHAHSNLVKGWTRRSSTLKLKR